MTRTRIELPSDYIFSTSIDLRISDINYGGHLGHDTILTLCHEARVRLLEKYGYSEVDIEGAGLIMADVEIVYKSESFYGDTINIKIAAGDYGKKSFEFLYLLENKKTGNEVARVKTGIVFFDYETRKSVAMPEKFKQIFFRE